MKKVVLKARLLLITVLVMCFVSTSHISETYRPGNYDGAYRAMERAIDKGTYTEEQMLSVAESNGFSASVVEQILNDGYMTEYVDRLKAGGWVRQDYTLPGTSSSASDTTNSSSTSENTGV